MLQGRPIKVFNFGRMHRDFTYIDDIVQGVVAALMASNLEHYEIINLGNHRAEDLNRVIAILEEELNVKAQQDLLPMQPGDIAATFADIGRARMKLGFQPATTIAEGIPLFVRWYLDYHGLPRP
jgi:UDP-glucuronate 4-epimerase